MAVMSVSDFRKHPATHIVSLGGQCETTYNLRRFFRTENAFPFDWWISPAISVAALIRSFDLDDLYSEAQLQEEGPGRHSIRHLKRHILLHHEFPRDEANEFGAGAGQVVPHWRDYIKDARAKTAYLASKLRCLNSSSNRLFFIRQRKNENGNDGLKELYCAVTEAFREATIAFLFVNYHPDPDLSHALFNEVVDRNLGWKGDKASWDEVLSASGVELESEPAASISSQQKSA